MYDDFVFFDHTAANGIQIFEIICVNEMTFDELSIGQHRKFHEMAKKWPANKKANFINLTH